MYLQVFADVADVTCDGCVNVLCGSGSAQERIYKKIHHVHN